MKKEIYILNTQWETLYEDIGMTSLNIAFKEPLTIEELNKLNGRTYLLLEESQDKEIERLQDQLQQKENIIKEVRERVLNEGNPIPSSRELLEILDKGDGREVMNNEVLNDLLYVLQQIDGYLDKGWTIDLNFTDIREKYKKDIENYENWD